MAGPCGDILDENGLKLLDETGVKIWDELGPCPEGGGDTSDGADTVADPLFYDWWRKRAQEERQKLEVATVDAEQEPLREETIEAIEVADSLADLRELELLAHERAVLNRLIADYQQYLDDDDDEALLLAAMH